MRKRIVLIMAIACILLITGCGASNSAENPAGADSQMTENTGRTDTEGVNTENTIDTVEVPSWATGTQMEGKLFQNLNLDGVGEADDEAYVSVYQFGDYEDKVTVISIHLGTGETMAQVLSVYGDYSFLTGRLFSEEKDAIILEVKVPASNYGAATVFALDVFPVGVDPIPTVVTRLDTSESIMLADGNIIEQSRFENTNVTFGTEVVDVGDMSCQGLSVYFTGEKGQFQEVQRILYWTDNGWTIISEEVPEIDIDTDALSPLDGVTMEVTECSDTSVTIKITNDTDKDIECGSDFCLEMQDEETGEWRELDEVIDNAAFTSEAYMIEKDSPYEKVINFEWLYGKLEPGRYRIVKTVTDFRGTGTIQIMHIQRNLVLNKI